MIIQFSHAAVAMSLEYVVRPVFHFFISYYQLLSEEGLTAMVCTLRNCFNLHASTRWTEGYIYS